MALAVGTPSATAAMVLARAGEARVTIRVAGEASAVERTAARELAEHLQRISGAVFTIETEEAAARETPGIFVGATRRAAALGVACGELGPEQWGIRSAGRDLLLFGGRPRGTLYAVYHFLEDELGVRWWTPFERDSPHRPRLRVGSLDRGGQPAFAYRDVYGAGGSPAFHARNRLNGEFAFLGPAWGGTEGYGPPHHVHSFYHYAPPAELFASHPEYYSEIDGKRTAERAQLCLSQDGLFEWVAERMLAYIAAARAEAAARGAQTPRVFDFSANDWGGECECERCRAVVEREVGAAGPLLEFVNRLADRMAVEEPGILVGTLAYMNTFDPPRRLRARENVVVRLAALYDRDFSQPVSGPDNADYREAIEGWRRVTDHLRIWEYVATWGDHDGALPLPNHAFLAPDYRAYLQSGVEGVFVQHDHLVLGDMRDLKLWMSAKLLEDPSRDGTALLHEFTDGYYGRAGRVIRDYLDLLGRAIRSVPTWVDYPFDVERAAYLDREFLLRAHALFDRAERRVAHDPLRLRRVRHARIGLDWVTLLLAETRLADRPAGDGSGARFALDLRAVATRVADTVDRQITLRLPPRARDGERLALASTRGAALLREILGPQPADEPLRPDPP